VLDKAEYSAFESTLNSSYHITLNIVRELNEHWFDFMTSKCDPSRTPIIM